MEAPLFVARDPRVFVVQPGAPEEGRIFVSDQSRWYERLKDHNGNAHYVHVADSDEEFERTLQEQCEPAVVELDVADPLVALVVGEFARAGSLHPEVPVVTDEGIAA